MSIFATPKKISEESGSDEGLNILFLHGLEGTPSGDKAIHLKTKWNANVPVLRTESLRALQAAHPGSEWQEMPKKAFAKAFNEAYSDVLAALAYSPPDVIVGSSLGGALLVRLILEDKWSGASVFLAPAIEALLGKIELPQIKNSVWILGEADLVIPNTPNIQYSMLVGGNLMISAGDNHRLEAALSSGLIDNAIITALELESMMDSAKP